METVDLGGALKCFKIAFALVVIMIDGIHSQRPCHDDGDCHFPSGFCRDHFCACDRSDLYCEVPKLPGDKCARDIDCYSSDLICEGQGDGRVCRCKKIYSLDMKYNKCFKEDGYPYDPVQNLIIPAIIVMSVGAMVYLGIKLFCNCGKLWRRRQSHLSRDLDSMTSSGNQQASWVASYRVFSPINNPNQAQLHHPPPCMGYFMPNLSTSPPPYEEALKHKVILSSYTTTPAPAYTPTAADPTPVPVHTQSTNRYSTGSDRDHVRPLRYYPGEGNPEVPAVWNSGRTRTVELEEVLSEEVRDIRPLRTAVCANNRSGTRQYSNVITRTNYDPPL